MSEQQIPNEAKFLHALGVNPDNVVAGSLKVEWQNGTPMVYFQMVHAVAPQAVGLAFLAAADQPEESGTVTELKKPQDRRPAKKTAARKRTTKGDGGGAQ